MKELISELKSKNISLSVENNELVIDFEGNLNEDLIARIKEKKSLLIDYLIKYNKGKKDYTTIPVIEPDKSYPVSSGQHRLWMLSQFDNGSSAYNMPVAVYLERTIDIVKFKEAIYSIIDRHEILRTIFEEDQNGEIRQCILENTNLGFRMGYEDFSKKPEAESLALSYIKEDSYKIFDLKSGPLFRTSLLQLTEEKYIFYFNMHHIISDGHSMSILIKEVLSNYMAYVNDLPSPLEPLRIHYKDYASWQKMQLENSLLSYQKGYWLDVFSGDLPVLDFPTDNARPVIKTYNGGIIKGSIYADTTSKFKSIVQELNGTLFMGLLSVLNVLLYRYTRQNDIIIGSPVTGRENADLENQIGFYVNTLALRTQFNEQYNFKELFRKVKKISLEAFAHQFYPFDKLVGDLELKRDRSRNALFDVMLVFETNNSNYKVLEGIEIKPVDSMEHRISKFDLTFNFKETKNELHYFIEYNSDLFDKHTIERLAVHLKQLIESIVSFPELSIDKINYLSKEEQEQLKVDFNDTTVPYSEDKTLVELFENQVKQNPLKTAIKCADRSLTFKALNEACNQLAWYLRKNYQVNEGDYVGIELDRSEWLVISILAIMKCGAAYVPVDPDYPTSRKEYMLSDSNCKCWINESELVKFNSSSNRNDAKRNLKQTITPGSLAYVMYTSGSTGRPKGVMLEHGGLVNRLEWMWKAFHFTSSDIVLQKTTFTFDVSVWELLMPVCWGCEMIICQKEDIISPARIVSLIEKHKITCLHFVPSMLTAFVSSLAENADQVNALQSLRMVITSGEALPLSLVKEWYKKTSIVIHNLYGPTEASIEATCYTTSANDKKILIGSPIANVQMYVLDTHHQLVPVGVAGEICIGGVGVARGYLNNPELTAEKFIPHPFKDGKRLYKTGDLGRWLPDGNIEYIGRKDDQVKIRGYRIEPGEIATALDSYEPVDSSAVIAKLMPSGENELIAYIVSNQAISIEKMRTYLGSILPSYMIPSYYVQLEKFPLTPSGKIDKRALPLPEESFIGTNVPFKAPQTLTEQALATIWETILNRKQIGLYDDFFASGGHSLKATRLLSQVHKRFQVKLTLNEIFEKTVLYQQVALIDQAQTVSYAPIPSAPLSTCYPLSSSQQRLYILSRFENANVAYNISEIFEFQGDLEIEALAHSLKLLVERHEILRTVFKEDEHQVIRQYIQPAEEVDIQMVFNDIYRNESSTSTLESLLHEGYIKPFDLNKGPLFRINLIRLSSDKWIFNYVMHHIISDGWSIELLMNEVLHFYKSIISKKAPALKALKIQYKDYACWQQMQLSTGEFALHKAYWLNQFTGQLPKLHLPADRPRPAIKTYNGGIVRKSISAELCKDLKGLNNETGATLFIKLLTILNTLFYRYTEQRDIIIGTPIAGREHPDLEGQIGFYLNTLALRTIIEENDSFNTLLERVKKHTLDAYSHQSYPFDRMVDDLQLRADFSRSVLFDVMIVLQNTSMHDNPPLLADLPFSAKKYDRTGQVMSKFDLLFDFRETDRGLELLIEYNNDIYKQDTIEQMSTHFEQLMVSIVNKADQQLSRIDYLTNSEQKKLIEDFNDTTVPYSEDKTLVELFENQVKQNPLKTAIKCADRSLTFKALNEACNQLAWYLRKNYQVNEGDYVGIELDRSEWLVISILAIMKCGAAYVPVDPDYPASRKEYMLSDSNCKCWINESELVKFNSSSNRNDAKRNLKQTITPGSLAYVMYTSGSTGRPKGVMLEHGGLVNRLEWMWKAFHFTSSDIVLQKTTFTFDVSVWELLMPVCWGCEMIICQKEDIISPARIVSLIEKHKITCLHFVPSMLTAFVSSLAENADQVNALQSLRMVITSGEALPLSLVKEWYKKTSIVIHNLYGPTEASIDVTYFSTSPEDKKIPIGYPIDNTQMYVLDTHHQLVPVGVAGEICIGGVGVARGYLNNPELTAEKFIPHPFKDGKRLYKTGDLGRWLPDGSIEYIGRKDDQVKIRGYRIELDEVNKALQSHPRIKEAVVLAKETETGDKDLVGYFVSEMELNVSDLKVYLGKQLPVYMIPAYFVQLEQLLFTSNGKIDKKALLSSFVNTVSDTVPYMPPQTPMESDLTGIFEEILNRKPVGIRDNFFVSGGDSIKAIKVVLALKNKLQLDISVNKLYDFPTIQELSSYISSQYTPESISEQLNYGLKEIEKLRQLIEKENEVSKKLPLIYEDIYPVTKIEEGIIYSSVLRPEAPVYNDQFLFFLEIDDINLFTKAIAVLVKRHPIFRTKYYMRSFSKFIKVVLPAIEMPVFIKDISSQSNEQKAEYINTYLKEDLQVIQNYEDSILWHLQLFRLNSLEYCAILSVHHAVLDGWSLSVFNTELSNLLSGKDVVEIKAENLKYSYKDYCAVLLGKTRSLKAETYWKALLHDFAINKLPFNYKGSVICDSTQMKKTTRLINDNLRLRLVDLSAKHQLSFKSICLAAHVFLLHILSTEDDVITGVVTHDRPEIEDGDKILGCFLNTVPIRVNVKEIPTVLSLLKHVNLYLGNVRSHEIHLSDIAKIAKDKTVSGNPIFDTLFNYTDFHSYKNVQDGSAVRVVSSELESLIDSPNEMTNTLLDLEVDKTHDLLKVSIKYVASYFHDSEIETALGLYVRILEYFATGVDFTLNGFSQLSETEKQQVVYDFNSTTSSYATKKTISQLFEEQVKRTPFNEALSQNGVHMTYQELNEQSNQLARYLLDKGVRTGDAVGLKVARNFEMIIGMYGILKAGASYVPVDPAYPLERQHYILTNSMVKLVITDVWPSEDYPGEIEFIIPAKEKLADYSTGDLSLTIDSTQLAYTIYTSGSTGTPKGVMIEHHSVINLIEWVNATFNVGATDRLLFITSMCFDLSVYDIFGILSSGGTLVIATQDDVQQIDRLKFILQEERITFWDSVPTTLSYLVKELEATDRHYRQASLRLVFLSGDWIPVQLPDKVKLYFPNSNVISLGGATEGTVWSNYFPIQSIDLKWSSIPYGKPIKNNFFYILNNELKPVPKGVTGELYIGGVGVARGYSNNPEKTRSSFKPDPFQLHNGGMMYATGDLGRLLPDGNMEFLGRKDNQIKIRGFRVELGEIESVLLRHADISEAVVNASKDASNQNQLCAYMVLLKPISKEAISDYLKKVLPVYMIPAYYVFMDALPLTSNGKINRSLLPKPIYAQTHTVVAEQENSEIEARLIKIWCDILNIEPLHKHDDLFDMGANSLSVGAFINRTQKELGIDLTIREIFTNPSISDIAQLINSKPSVSFQLISSLPHSDSGYPLSSSQQRLWILSQFEDSNMAYNIPGVYEFEGQLDQNALFYSFNKLIERHEILRTVFKQTEDGNIRQFVRSGRELNFIPLSVDLRDSGKENMHSTLFGYLSEAFDLSNGPLIRACLYQLENNKWILAYCMHHIISDGWSMNILIRELLLLYNAYLNNKPSPLESLRIQYKDYASWQAEGLTGNKLQSHGIYWKNIFSDEIPVLEFPVDKPRPLLKTYNGKVLKGTISAELTDKLKTIVNDMGATLFMGLLSAIKALLYKYTKQEDIVIGTPVAGREDSELENQIGFYVNTLALRTRFKGSNSFKELMQEVKEVTLTAYTHQQYPFDRLIDDLHVKRDMSRHALFDVMLVLQNANTLIKQTEKPEHLNVRMIDTIDHEISKFDLTFDFKEINNELLYSIEYNTDLYNEGTIKRLLTHLEELLKSVTADPGLPIDELDYLTKEEAYQLITQFNDTRLTYPDSKSVVDLFEEQVLKTPDAIAVVSVEKRLTYLELSQRSNQLANYLIKNYQLEAGDFVGVILDKSPDLIVSIWAILKCGAAYVPVAPELPIVRKKYIIKNAGLKIIITQVDYAMDLDNPADPVLYIGDRLSLQDSSMNQPCVKIDPENLMYAIYTSGSTGEPKGAMVSVKSFANLARWYSDLLKLNAHDNVLLLAPIGFDLTQKNIFSTLISGARLYLEKTYEDYGKIAETIARNGISVINVAPSAFYPLLDEQVNANFKNLSTIKKVVLGGEPIVKKEFYKWIKSGYFEAEVINSYGPTECTDVVSYHTIVNDNEWQSPESVPIGKPIANASLFVMDSKNKLVPVGVEGEICISGICVGKGYLNGAHLTTEKFVCNPYLKDQLMYKTGDIGRWLPDGNMEFIRRKDDQIKIRGYRIELGEITAALEKFTDVETAVVLSKNTDGGETELIAFVVGKSALNVSSIREYLTQLLPLYMIPSYYVQIDKIPLSANGKIDRKKLMNSEISLMETGVPHMAPRNEIEEKLVEMWSQCLQIEKDKISIKSSFFDLGGNSIKLIRLLRLVNTRLNAKTTLMDLFNNPTIEKLAGYYLNGTLKKKEEVVNLNEIQDILNVFTDN